jgi:tRNA(fMet)-specific endonuclease VapC
MTYYVLDTDHLSVLQRREEPAFTVLSKKLSAYSPDLIFVTIISFQEQFQGWMAFINRSASASQLVTAYSKLENLIRSFSLSQILPFDQNASAIADSLKSQHLGIGTLDLRIASIALSQDAVLLTRNVRDFEKVPNLKVENWTF